MAGAFAMAWKKLPKKSFWGVLRLEMESWLVTSVGSLPGVYGFAVRTLIYKLLFKKLEGFSFIQPRVTFVNTNNLLVGPNFACNSGTYINALGQVKIGRDVLIGSNVTISAGRHPIDGLANTILSTPAIPDPIEIGDGVWIGAGAVILPGVRIAQGTVIGANSVVTRDTEENSVVIGIPAKFARFRK